MIELKELTMDEGMPIYDMILEIGPGENGYVNSGFNVKTNEFVSYLKKNIESARGINLKEGRVPQTMFFLYINGMPVGIGKLRHYLNQNLKESGGHIGYTIRPKERGKGYGIIMLRELLKKAKELNIHEVLLTCNKENTPSRKVIERNKGLLIDEKEGKCKYLITTK